MAAVQAAAAPRCRVYGYGDGGGHAVVWSGAVRGCGVVPLVGEGGSGHAWMGCVAGLCLGLNGRLDAVAVRRGREAAAAGGAAGNEGEFRCGNLGIDSGGVVVVVVIVMVVVAREAVGWHPRLAEAIGAPTAHGVWWARR